tara:strand:+ start:105 stop:674 length:570 start_codon:yes stop_codon:yes gene_type:complete
MSKSQIIILNLKALYNILLEHKQTLQFDIIACKNENELFEKKNQDNTVVIVDKKTSLKNFASKNIIILSELPIRFVDLIDKINTNFLRQKYSSQSNLIVKKYKLDLNSRIMSYQEKSLRLTEREIEIILFLNNKDKAQKIDILQKEVWGYSNDLETHTVETHVYRLRKKVNEIFGDEDFLLSSKDGYKI